MFVYVQIWALCRISFTARTYSDSTFTMGKGGAADNGPMLEDEKSIEEEFPFPLTDVDRHNLSITDDQFKPHTWEELKQIIGQCTDQRI